MALVYSFDRSNALVPVLVSLCVALWFILRGELFYVLPCVILFLFVFRSFWRCGCLAWGGGGWTWCFRAFVWFVWEGLRFVIVALPGLFFYLLLENK